MNHDELSECKMKHSNDATNKNAVSISVVAAQQLRAFCATNDYVARRVASAMILACLEHGIPTKKVEE